MARLLPDPTFYPTPNMAGEAPPESLAYVALLTSSDNGKKDALGVVDTDSTSATYGQLIRILRRAWIDLNLLWSAALLVSAAMTLRA